MDPVPATYTSGGSIFNSEVPGAFSIDDAGQAIIYVCPCGCGQLISLPILIGPKQDRSWQWDGNREQPTLTPSIRRLDGCRFHGFLTVGVWTFCGDSGA